MKKTKDKNKKGFTLLFAVLVSTLVLAVGSSIISMALRQTILSGVGRDSQFAFYASNTGIECALYWDLSSAVTFPTSTDDTVNIDCAGSSVTTEVADGDYSDTTNNEYAISKFTISFDNVGDNELIDPNYNPPYCVDVYVRKFAATTASGRDRIGTEILSRGYNTCDTDNARRIERGLELTY